MKFVGVLFVFYLGYFYSIFRIKFFSKLLFFKEICWKGLFAVLSKIGIFPGLPMEEWTQGSVRLSKEM
jgi:hypothetical protein